MGTLHLLDTNLLVRLIDRSAVQHAVARRTIHRLRRAGHPIHTLPQNIAEFWNVITRPKNYNGLGQSPVLAERMLNFIERNLTVLPDDAQAYAFWRRLVLTYAVQGKQVHDARIVATMLAHGVMHLVTFNIADFARYSPEGLVVVDPATI